MFKVIVYTLDDRMRIQKQLKHILSEKIQPTLSQTTIEVRFVQNFLSFYHGIPTMDLDEASLFLIDIELNSFVNGIDIAEEIRKKNSDCKIIFLSSHDEKGIEIINRKIDPDRFIVKSNDELLMETALKETLLTMQKSLSAKMNKSDYSSKLFFKNATYFLINYSDINYMSVISGIRNTVFINTIDGEIAVEGNLKKFVREGLPPHFFSNLKAYIINTENIEKILISQEVVIFRNGDELILSVVMIRKLLKFLK